MVRRIRNDRDTKWSLQQNRGMYALHIMDLSFYNCFASHYSELSFMPCEWYHLTVACGYEA